MKSDQEKTSKRAPDLRPDLGQSVNPGTVGVLLDELRDKLLARGATLEGLLAELKHQRDSADA